MSGREPEERVRFRLLCQEWRDVLFLHWRCPPEAIASLLPPRLEPDVCDGSAWVSLTPFRVHRGGPPVLTGRAPFSDFAEANLRTYVRGPGGVDGLWFLTLEAADAPTVLGGRLAAPYRLADVTVEAAGPDVTYGSARRGEPSVGFEAQVRPGPPLSDADALDHWLTGRWRAWTRRAGVLATVPVRHQAWPLHEVELLRCREALLAPHGVVDAVGPDRLHWSPGVDACLGAPRPVVPWLTRAGR